MNLNKLNIVNIFNLEIVILNEVNDINVGLGVGVHWEDENMSNVIAHLNVVAV